ncbi:multicopper oxidase family protein [Mycobacterium sp. 852014-52144_SCH5372336]|uniref:multicopper oxidase family protein n=1 Tax=Mycobacterium sp. 852014-52144_SCH5372336 TaxID=1834115 RepID=UPI0007FEA290|nr:multicopper oxidase family protein [Mycobacterium sp. 852014-52144_SCH5372336]OBB77778.1 oxidase [Mycobacterium sp. 852014-52144_SCH5372336]
MHEVAPHNGGFNRRRFLGVTAAAGLALIGCGSRTEGTERGGAVAAAEARRPHSGRTVSATLTAKRTNVDLGGALAETVAYNDAVPGPLLRAGVGDELAVTVRNRLNRATGVHWHGIALRNDMDGAAPATPDIGAGGEFTYRFSVPHPGTYWAHPHTGLDADTGLYFPIIVDDPADPGDYDAEWLVILDDWTDGIGSSPQQIYDGLRDMPGPAHRMPSMGESDDMVPGVGGVGRSDLLGGDAGDVTYPYYVANGRIPQAPSTFRARPGQRIRIRIINAGSDTAFRVALVGHPMMVTHTDGFPVVPREVDAVLIGMGERYDVVITAGDGVFPLVAAAEGKSSAARALLITGAGSPPPLDFKPAELARRIGTIGQFTAEPAVALAQDRADVTLPADLNGSMMNYDWMINGRPFVDTRPLAVQQDQRVTLVLNNMSMMWHPMHLHGHTFEVVGHDGRPGARKDTVIVLPMQRLAVTFVADNPGGWMLHCHNTYHQEAGMMTALNYET